VDTEGRPECGGVTQGVLGHVQHWATARAAAWPIAARVCQKWIKYVYIWFIGIRMLRDLFTRGYGINSVQLSVR
jgi:hypothetical protein